MQVGKGSADQTETALAMMDWVHEIRGTRENEEFFVLGRLRAMPVQVLHSGGDCADKSRLLTALLREVSIPATMVMCYHRDTRVPTHTVVEARVGLDEYVILDPAYGVTYPNSETGKYYGLLELRANPEIADARIRKLATGAKSGDSILAYNPVSAAYDHATSINWDKNWVTKSVCSVARVFWGDEVYRFARPIVIEEPKLFVATVLLLIAGMIPAMTSIVSYGCTRAKRMVVHSGASLCGP